jgi:hypothetical protein
MGWVYCDDREETLEKMRQWESKKKKFLNLLSGISEKLFFFIIPSIGDIESYTIFMNSLLIFQIIN